MGVLGGLVEWAQATFGPYGIIGLILLAFTEAIISPIPPDVLLPILAKGRSLTYAAWLGAITTVASVAGAAVGYWIGKTFSPWVHRKFSGPRLARVENWYTQYGEWIVVVAAVSPIPFKVFTVASGLLGLRFWPFMLAALVGRGLRFIPEALLAARYGDQVIAWIDRYQLEVGVVTLVGLVLFYLWTRHREATDPEEPEAAPNPEPGPEGE